MTRSQQDWERVAAYENLQRSAERAKQAQAKYDAYMRKIHIAQIEHIDTLRAAKAEWSVIATALGLGAANNLTQRGRDYTERIRARLERGGPEDQSGTPKRAR